MRKLIIPLVLCLSAIALGQFPQQGLPSWTQSLPSKPGSFFCQAATTDPRGNLVLGGGGFDLPARAIGFDVRFISGEGVPGWAKTLVGSPVESDVIAITTDSGGNVVLTGKSVSDNTDLDWLTAKYDVNGNLVWQ